VAAIERVNLRPLLGTAQLGGSDAAQRFPSLDDVLPLIGDVCRTTEIREEELPARIDHALRCEAPAIGHLPANVRRQDALELRAATVVLLGDPPQAVTVDDGVVATGSRCNRRRLLRLRRAPP